MVTRPQESMEQRLTKSELKNVYQSPELTVYGPVVRLTQNKLTGGRVDSLVVTKT